METTFKQSEFQRVKCIKDNKLYVFKIKEHPDFYSEDFALIRCYLIEKNYRVDFSKEIEIYGKDLVSMDVDEW
jgi:hypothetical protein